jgi:hypothetical protein
MSLKSPLPRLPAGILDEIQALGPKNVGKPDRIVITALSAVLRTLSPLAANSRAANVGAIGTRVSELKRDSEADLEFGLMWGVLRSGPRKRVGYR